MLPHGRPHAYTSMASCLHVDGLMLTHSSITLTHGGPYAYTRTAPCLHMDGLMLKQQTLHPLIYLSPHLQGVLTDFVYFSCTDGRRHSHCYTDSESSKPQQCRVRDLAQCLSCTSVHIRSCFSETLRSKVSWLHLKSALPCSVLNLDCR